MAKSSQNRPFKFGERDRREFIVKDSEVSLISINNTSGDPIFLGRSKVGELLNDDKWQIQKVAYDSSEGVTRITWPENIDSNASSDYEFIWSSVNDLVITDITKANPAVVTVSDISTLLDGDLIVIQEVVGMTKLNFDGSNIYTVANSSGNTFEIQGIDTSSFIAYISDGIVVYGEVINYTYS